MIKLSIVYFVHMSKEEDNIDEFEYDYDALLKKPKSLLGTTKYVPLEHMVDIPDDLTLQERWKLHQEIGKRQYEAGVQIPVNSHRCHDYIEDIVSPFFFARFGEANMVLLLVCEYLHS